MLCPRCGTEHPEIANFCMICAMPLRGVDSQPPQRVPRWEYSDLVIPLEANARVFIEYPQEARHRFNEVVNERLERARQDGWEPAEPVDFDSLKSSGRIEEVRHRRFGHLTVYSSVTIRLRRPLPS